VKGTTLRLRMNLVIWQELKLAYISGDSFWWSPIFYNIQTISLKLFERQVVNTLKTKPTIKQTDYLLINQKP